MSRENQKHSSSTKEIVLRASKAVSEMPRWKTDGFDRRDVIVLKNQVEQNLKLLHTDKELMTMNTLAITNKVFYPGGCIKWNPWTKEFCVRYGQKFLGGFEDFREAEEAFYAWGQS